MTALAILLATVLILRALREITRELRAIAEEQADERRKHGINAGLDANRAARWQG